MGNLKQMVADWIAEQERSTHAPDSSRIARRGESAERRAAPEPPAFLEFGAESARHNSDWRPYKITRWGATAGRRLKDSGKLGNLV